MRSYAELREDPPSGLAAELISIMRHALATGELPSYVEFGMPDSFARSGFIKEHEVREEFINTYGFAIPCDEAMQRCAQYAPLLEVGAGSGTWTRILRKRRVNILATDPGLSHHAIRHGANWQAVEALQAKTAIRRYRDRNVLMVWPAYRETWPTQALKAMRVGRYLLTVTEGDGGCCGNDAFFAVLRTCFEHVRETLLPVFVGLHDRLDVYRKARPYRRDRIDWTHIDERSSAESLADARRSLEKYKEDA